MSEMLRIFIWRTCYRKSILSAIVRQNRHEKYAHLTLTLLKVTKIIHTNGRRKGRCHSSCTGTCIYFLINIIIIWGFSSSSFLFRNFWTPATSEIWMKLDSYLTPRLTWFSPNFTRTGIPSQLANLCPSTSAILSVAYILLLQETVCKFWSFS